MNKHQHLRDSNETYGSHSIWAVTSGFQLIWAGLMSLVHAVYPGWFSFGAAKIVIDLYYKRLHNHTNKNYQDYIQQVKDQNHQ
jgi:hypothetical protein